MATEVHVTGNAAPRASLLRWLTLPVWGLIRPRAAAASLATISRPALAALLALSLCAYAAVLIGLMLWDQTTTQVWVNMPSAPPGSQPVTWQAWTEAQQRPLSDVWAEWRQDAYGGLFGPAEVTLLLVIALGLTLIALLAWLNLPFVHRRGSAWSSYKRTFRAAAGILWPLTGLTLIAGTIFVIDLHASYGGGAFGPPLDDPGGKLMVAVSIAVWLLVGWLRGALRGIEVPDPDLALPPRCEGCGYDLTHRAADGLCTECGLPQAESLDPQRNRPGNAWTDRRDLAGWFRSTRAVLRRPSRFYRALRLRTPPAPDAAFGIRSLVMVAAGALVWGLIMLKVAYVAAPLSLGDLTELVVLGPVFISLGTFGCWLGYRVIAALVVTAWLTREALPDFRWAAKVIAYESSFLWVFCAFWGLMFSSLVVFQDWVSRLMGFSGFFPAGEFFTIVGGTLLLAAIWIVRYTIAYRAIRWSNF